MKEFHRLGNTILDSPAAGIGSNEELHRGFLIVGDDERRLFTPIAAHDDLSDFAIVFAQGDLGFEDQGVLVFPLLVGNGNPFPGADFLKLRHELVSPAAKSDELHPLLVELGEVPVGREL